MDENKKKDDELTSFEDLAIKYLADDESDTSSPPVKKNEEEIELTEEKSSSGEEENKVKSGETMQFSIEMPAAPKEKISTASQKNISAIDGQSISTVSSIADIEKDKKKVKSKHKKKRFDFSRIDVSRFSKRTYIFFGIVIALSVSISIYAVFCLNDVLAMNKDTDIVTVTVSDTEVDSMNKAIDLLHENKLINCPLFCKVFAKMRAEELDAPYSLGTFELNRKMGVEGMLVAIQGATKEKETINLTFPEGFTVPQVIARLTSETNNVCDEAALINVIENEMYDISIASGLTSKDEVPYRLEGFMFPAKYQFYVGENPKSVVKKFLDALNDNFSQELRDKAAEMGYSIREVITMASIIQKEAANAEQMPIIAAILYNRGTELPRLQCDSTAHYINQYVSKNLTVASKHTADFYLAKYDTYAIEGLPAGPICNPGMDAIEAALNPDAKTTSSHLLYYCHDKQGKMYTAKTYDQHKINVAKYLV